MDCLFISSEPGRGDFEEILRVSQDFHADIAGLVFEKPVQIAERSNRWCEADKVTWGEKKLEDVEDIDQEILSQLNPVLEKLLLSRQPLPETVKSQLIHADLVGNVLFQNHSPKEAPAIIDLTFYWRPVRYAEAIIVADGLAWNGKGRDLIQIYRMDESGRQMLVRALYWRCLTYAIDPDFEWIQDRLLDLVERYMTATEIVLTAFPNIKS